MFPKGVSAYVNIMQDLIPGMKDGTIRTAIDTGCGVTNNSSSCFHYITQKASRELEIFKLVLLFTPLHGT